LEDRLTRISARAKLCITRAQISLEGAEELVQLRDESGEVAAIPLVAELLRESVHWSGLALVEVEGIRTEVPLELNGPLWDEVRAKVDPTVSGELWTTWLAKSYSHTWEDPPSKERLAEYLALANEWVKRAKAPALELDALWFKRILRLIFPLLGCAAIAGGLAYSSHRSAVAAETGYPFRTSSVLARPEGGCVSPSQECDEVRYFFHTHEESSPWIEFDLGAPMTIKRFLIANRNDCADCAIRAVPLVVEVSDDQKEWRVVAKRKENFDDWGTKLTEIKARWIRFRSTKRTFLHFRQVRIQAAP